MYYYVRNNEHCSECVIPSSIDTMFNVLLSNMLQILSLGLVSHIISLGFTVYCYYRNNNVSERAHSYSKTVVHVTAGTTCAVVQK